MGIMKIDFDSVAFVFAWESVNPFYREFRFYKLGGTKLDFKAATRNYASS